MALCNNLFSPRSPFLLAVLLLHLVTDSSCFSESEILLKFKDSLENNAALSNWKESTSACNHSNLNWIGVLCDDKGIVWGLKLENMGLKGSLDLDILAGLPSLRTISFMNNNLEGQLPKLNLPSLKSIYLSNNKFSGQIPDDAFDGMVHLKKLFLAQNQFSGQIPMSLTTLPKLLVLHIEENHFEGQMPDFQQRRLVTVNLSYNNFEGPIPDGISKSNPNFFKGNDQLCGEPLKPCESRKLSVVTLVVAVIVVVIALSAILAVIVILRQRHQPTDQPAATASVVHSRSPSADFDKMEKGLSEQSTKGGKKCEPSPMLSFLKDDREKFELGDLLKASAEILGSGRFGYTYKAALGGRQAVVVKRFRKMNNVSKEEFHEHMRRLGKLNHPNLLPLVAFYYRKEEKLFFSDYIDNVSLSIHLHGNRSRVRPKLDWPTRLKIVKGTVRGLAHLNKELPGLIAPHGHLKSSNVVLNKSFEPFLTDYALIPVVNQEHAQHLMVAYKSPEYKKNGRITKKTDVWSLGILILEIMTGKIPTNFLQQEQSKGSETDLASWVKSAVQQDSTVEVFDKEMGGTRNGEGEMIKLLKIGLNCCEENVDKRLDLKEVHERIEELKNRDHDDDFYSTYASEADMRSSRGLSDDFVFHG